MGLGRGLLRLAPSTTDISRTDISNGLVYQVTEQEVLLWQRNRAMTRVCLSIVNTTVSRAPCIFYYYFLQLQIYSSAYK